MDRRGSREDKIYHWLSGIIDGDGNFDITNNKDSNSNKTKILKSIRIKLHNRDIRILTRIQNYLHYKSIAFKDHSKLLEVCYLCIIISWLIDYSQTLNSIE